MNRELSNKAEQTARLRYRCRRGLLELDTLLAGFPDSPQFQKLNDTQRSSFEQFLEESDPQLLAWLLGQESCPIAAYRDLIQAIHSFSAQR